MGLSAEQMLKRYEEGMARAGARYAEGVAAFQGDPTQMAAAAVDYWQTQVSSQAARSNFVKGLTKPGTGEAWRNNSKTIGAARLASGAQKGKAKYAAALQTLAPAAERSKAAAREMRKNGVDWRERMIASAEIMKQAFGKT